MKAIAFLLLLIIIICLVVLAMQFLRQAWKNARKFGAHWEVQEITKRGQTQFWLVKAGEDPIRFGDPLSEHLPEYEYQDQRTTLLIGAQERCDTKNRRLGA